MTNTLRLLLRATYRRNYIRPISKALLISFFWLGIGTIAMAQNISITGVVVDENKETLPGVTVNIKGTNTSIFTSIEGVYTLNLSSQNAVLVFTHIGYKTKEVAVGTQKTLNVTMEPSINTMNDVVVIGYGEVKRHELTGAVGSVSIDDMMKAPIRSFDEALAGRVAGVQVTSTEGEPGSAINIVIRGQNSITQDNSPLYVIDGFPMEDFNTSTLNPADIESIDILKDASASAIYGSRGANGVIMITTKKGVEGKPVISYDGMMGWSHTNNKMDLMNPYDFVRLQYDIDPIQARLSYLKPDGYDLETRTLEYYKNSEYVDWQKRVLQTAPMHSHTLSFLGGTSTTKYSASLNYMKQEGVVKRSGYDRMQGRLRIDQDVNKNLKIGLNTSYSENKQYGTSVRMPSSNAEASLNLMYNMWGYRPVTGGSIDDLLWEDEDTEIVELSSYGNRYNPMLYINNEDRELVDQNFIANAYFENKFGKYVKLRVSGGINRTNSAYEIFYNSKHPSAQLMSGQIRGVNANVTRTTKTNLLNENTLSFSRTYNRVHKVYAVGGLTLQENSYSSLRGETWLIPRESLGISGMDEGDAQPLTTLKTGNTLMSWLGRFNYDYDSRYYLTVSFRADGSSKFPEGNKWGYFPSASAAWRISNEKFLKNNRVISDAKLRAGYGVLGNNRVGDHISMSQLTLSTAGGYAWNGNLVQGAQPTTLGNDKLKWESTKSFDFGVDLSLFSQRFTITADYYKKKTTDLLLNANMAPSSGYTKAMLNIGSVQNHGFEFSFSSVNIDNRHFTWASSFNIAFNRSKVLELADGQKEMLTNLNWNASYGSMPLYKAEVGQPIAKFIGMVWDGNYQIDDFTWQNSSDPSIPHSQRQYVLKDGIADNGLERSQIKPGYIKYKDIDNDGTIDANDRVVIGDPTPKYSGGFSNNFTYKGFDLNVFFQFSVGNDIMNANRLLFEGTYRYGLNQFASFNDRWSPETPDAPNHVAGGGGNMYYSTRTLEDGSYLRLKTVQLGYLLPQSVLRKTGLTKVRAYIAAQNLYTWTNYTGYDPEVAIYNSALTPSFDYLSYPRSRTYSVGLNITF